MFDNIVKSIIEKALTENKENFEICIPNIIFEQFKEITEQHGYTYEFNQIVEKK
jgi:hypothetical protein